MKLPAILYLICSLSFLSRSYAQEFSPYIQIEGGNYYDLPHLGDLDGDGDLDLLSAPGDNGGLSWLQNDGNAEFTSVVLDASILASNAQAIYDYEDDGDLDIFLLAKDEENTLHSDLVLFENQGGGIFAEAQILLDIETEITAPRPLAVGDGNSDGNADAAHLDYYGETNLSYVENDGMGGMTFIPSQDNNLTYSSIQMVNIDGIPGDELIATGPLVGIDIYKTDNSPWAFPWQEPSDYSYPSIEFSDLNGDESLDMLIASPSSNIIAWYANDGEGAFSDATIINSTIEEPEVAAAGDLDGDGDNDVVYSDTFQGMLYYQLNDGLGGLSDPVLIGSGGGWGALTMEIDDLDGDGDNDIIVANGELSTLGWYRNGLISDVHEVASVLISMTPNPMSDYTILSFPALTSQSKLSILDLQGRVIRTETLASGIISIRLSRINLTAGQYLIRLENQSTVYTSKLQVSD